MDKPKVLRKLAAVFCADVVGYSRLMEADEEATLATLKNHHVDIFASIEAHRGRVVNAPGDALLAEFVSVTDAVACAVDIQKTLAGRNESLSPERRMLFRIGINLGDVMVEGDAIYGDGINIAARLEALAEGGGVCISGPVYDSVNKKLPLVFESLGEKKVKNIAQPVRVYRHQPGWTIGGAGEASPSAASPSADHVSDGEAVRAILAGKPPPLPDQPSIAVLAFQNMSGDPEQEYFSDGLSEDIITGLSRIPFLFVVARNSSFIYKGRPVDLRQVGRELGVRYVLEGSVRKAGERVRITAQLIDAAKGRHLWAERYDRDLADVFTVQDEITERIITALDINLVLGDIAILIRKTLKNPQALDQYYRGLQFLNSPYREGAAPAKQNFEEVIRLEPESLRGYVCLGMVYLVELNLGWSSEPGRSLAKAEELSSQVLEMEPDSPEGLAPLGMIMLAKKEYDQALEHANRAVALSPNTSYFFLLLAMIQIYAGNPQLGLNAIQRAIRLSPFPPITFLTILGLAFRFNGRFADAANVYGVIIQREPDNLFGHVGLAATCAGWGREEQARASALEVLRINPQFSAEAFVQGMPYRDQAMARDYIAALRKAGLE